MAAADFDNLTADLSAYLDGELDSSRRAEVEALLERSAEARRTLADLRRVASGLREMPRASAPDDLVASILSESGVAQRVQREGRSPEFYRRIVRFSRLSIAALFFMVFGAVLNEALRPTRQAVIGSNSALVPALAPGSGAVAPPVPSPALPGGTGGDVAANDSTGPKFATRSADRLHDLGYVGTVRDDAETAASAREPAASAQDAVAALQSKGETPSRGSSKDALALGADGGGRGANYRGAIPLHDSPTATANEAWMGLNFAPVELGRSESGGAPVVNVVFTARSEEEYVAAQIAVALWKNTDDPSHRGEVGTIRRLAVGDDQSATQPAIQLSNPAANRPQRYSANVQARAANRLINRLTELTESAPEQVQVAMAYQPAQQGQVRELVKAESEKNAGSDRGRAAEPLSTGSPSVAAGSAVAADGDKRKESAAAANGKPTKSAAPKPAGRDSSRGEKKVAADNSKKPPGDKGTATRPTGGRTGGAAGETARRGGSPPPSAPPPVAATPRTEPNALPAAKGVDAEKSESADAPRTPDTAGAYKAGPQPGAHQPSAQLYGVMRRAVIAIGRQVDAVVQNVIGGVDADGDNQLRFGFGAPPHAPDPNAPAGEIMLNVVVLPPPNDEAEQPAANETQPSNSNDAP